MTSQYVNYFYTIISELLFYHLKFTGVCSSNFISFIIHSENYHFITIHIENKSLQFKEKCFKMVKTLLRYQYTIPLLVKFIFYPPPPKVSAGDIVVAMSVRPSICPSVRKLAPCGHSISKRIAWIIVKLYHNVYYEHVTNPISYRSAAQIFWPVLGTLKLVF